MMTFQEATHIVTGLDVEDGPGWEQQQACEERQQFEVELAALNERISDHILGIEWALRELQQLQRSLLSGYMYRGHISMQGGHDHEL
jgi:uncharacterized protein YicC (UPF0701 family)